MSDVDATRGPDGDASGGDHRPGNGPTGDGPSRGGPTRDELRLRLYELLREQVERERQWRLRRMAGGFAVVGVIVGYAFLVDELRFIALTPMLYGIVAMVGLRTTVEIMYLTRHLVRLEDGLSETEPLFRWETRYGTFGDGQALELSDVDLNAVPNLALYALLVSVYFLLVGFSLVTWSPVGAVTGGVLLLGYAVFTLLFVLIVAVGYLHFRRLEEDIAAVARGS